MIADDFFNFLDARDRWSEETFGPRKERGPIGPLRHLEKEAKEAYDETDADKQKEEIADCIFLVFDAAMRAGMSRRDVVNVCNAKLVKNKTRTWPKRVGDEPVEHVR